jgi:hypothetical protein
VVLWAAAVILAAAAARWRPPALLPAAQATLGPFATLAAIIAGSVLAGRLMRPPVRRRACYSRGKRRTGGRARAGPGHPWL